jgi:hypothetical protein
MASKGIISGQEGQETTAWVQLPQGQTTGRTMQTLLLSLARQIKAKHMEKKVERMKIDPKTRRIIVQFEEA